MIPNSNIAQTVQVTTFLCQDNVLFGKWRKDVPTFKYTDNMSFQEACKIAKSKTNTLLLHVHMPLLQNHTLKNEYLLLKHRHKCGAHTQTDCFVQTKLIVRSVPPTFPNTEDKGMPVNILRLFMFLLLEQQHLYLLQVTGSLLGLQFHP